MFGKVEKITGSREAESKFVIRVDSEGAPYPVHSDDVFLRGLDKGQTNEGMPVMFLTNRETGIAEIMLPEKVIGCVGNAKI